MLDRYTVMAGAGTWSVNVTPAQATALANGAYTIIANVSDAAGNAAVPSSHGFSSQQTVLGTPGDDSFTAPSGTSSFDGHGGVDTINFNFRLVDANVSYLGNTTVIDGPSGSHTVLTGFEVFKFTDGTVNNNDSDPLVDDVPRRLERACRTERYLQCRSSTSNRKMV